jgi:hypothetical protein
LLVIATLVPLLTYLETAIWDARLGTAPRWFTLPVLAVSVGYLAGAAVWALRAVSVGTYHRVGAADLIKLWSSSSVLDGLINETLIAVHRTQDQINAKVSAIKMTYAFTVRAIVGFFALLLVEAVSEIGNETGFWSIIREVLQLKK